MLNPSQKPRARHLKRTRRPPGVARSKPINTARGTPEDRHFVVTTACGLHYLFVHRAMGCLAPPAFRAPSDFQFEGGEVNKGAPGADRTIRDGAALAVCL